MAEAIVSIVVGRLTDLLIEEPQVLHEVSDEIQQLVTELTRIKTFLTDADSRISEDKIHILLAEVRDLAYDAEHAVETLLVGKTVQRMNSNKFSRRIRDIKRKISVLYSHFRDYNIKSALESPESSNSSYRTEGKLKRFHFYTTVEPEIFVGFKKDVDHLVAYLVDESDDCYPLISICGMGGLGKTTLAQKIYNHSTIKTYFAGLAWVSISQKWQTKLVLQRILICLVPDKEDEILALDEDKLVKNLLQIQEKKKCLIVLDDIWSNDAWDSIKEVFTAEKSLSKLMLTSRNVDVAEYVNPEGFIHQPRTLSADQSWELLQLKALPTRGDYLDITRDFKRMENLGREMVKNCAGLPLAIVILGGILVTKPSLLEWEKVYDDSLSSLKKGTGLGENQQKQLFDILVGSYNNLPPQLKPCFLYLGKFMEDEWIDAETLYKLLIAEGMILSSDKMEGEIMMQVAESYMGELVHKSMVQVRFDDLESSPTKFKSFSLHDLMRDLSLSQAKAEHFFGAVDLREGNDFTLSMFASTRRLVVHCDQKNTSKIADSYFVKKPIHQNYRSMLLMNAVTSLCFPPVLGSHLANFRLLRVLSLENVYLARQTISGTLFGTKIGRVLGSLVYLRYLNVSNSNLMVFPWIQKLVLLQTLNLERQSNIFIRPMSSNVLSKLAHLRHLSLPEEDCKRLEKNFKLRFNGLSKLETLEDFDTKWCEVKDLSNLSSLRRLKLIVTGSYDQVEEMMKYLSGIALSSTSCLRYLDLTINITDLVLDIPDIIRQLFWDYRFILWKLKIDSKLPEMTQLFEQKQVNCSQIDVSLMRITTLRFWNSHFEEDPMPVLEKIPTLRILILFLAYKGKEIMFSAGGFPKLIRLHLWYLPELVRLRVEEGSMPLLQHLSIYRCHKLEELPEGLRFLSSLGRLVLQKMPSDFCDRVRVVNDKQGPDFYKVAHVPHLHLYTD